MEKKRIEYLDVARGIAILLVLWGHSIQYFSLDTLDCFENNLFQFIYSFHMPLFMLISGYLYFYVVQKRSLKELICKRILTLAVPACIWGSIRYGLELAEEVVKGSGFSFEPVTWLNWIFSVWFLWSVLFASLLTAFISKCIPKKLQIPVFMMMLPLLIILPNHNLHMYMYPYFIVGFLGNRYAERLEESKRKALFSKNVMSKALITTTVLFILMFIFYEKKHLIYVTGVVTRDIPFGELILIDGYRWMIGLCGSILALTFAMYLSAGKKLQAVSALLSYAGKYSLEIYVVQMVVLEYIVYKILVFVAGKMDSNPLTGNMLVFDFVITPLAAVLVAAVILIIVKGISRIPYVSRILFGRGAKKS